MQAVEGRLEKKKLRERQESSTHVAQGLEIIFHILERVTVNLT